MRDHATSELNVGYIPSGQSGMLYVPSRSSAITRISRTVGILKNHNAGGVRMREEEGEYIGQEWKLVNRISTEERDVRFTQFLRIVHKFSST